MKPCSERRAGLLKDRPGHRIDVITAMVAGICRASSYPIVFALDSAFLAQGSAIRPAFLLDELHASVIIRELGIEVFEGILLASGDALSLFATFFHNKDSLPYFLLVVKG